MKVQPTGTNNFYGTLQRSTTGGVIPPTFKCHKATVEKMRDYGKVIQDTGIFKGYKLDIYSAYSKEGDLVHKLYYLSDSVGNWIKSKLKYYSGGKCYKTIKGGR